MLKDLQITVLFDFYRNILTEKQAEAVDLYYNEDLSLAEISDHLGITRQGVRDCIKKAENVMREMESGLNLAARHTAIHDMLSRISAEIDALSCEPEKLRSIKKLLTKLEES